MLRRETDLQVGAGSSDTIASRLFEREFRDEHIAGTLFSRGVCELLAAHMAQQPT